ncbi:MAG: hypothetical protein IT204_23865 [Fimbriimonadaceae bacterium]|nr:hypothetical protein [Fimbriimonadaceae bacterium]
MQSLGEPVRRLAVSLALALPLAAAEPSPAPPPRPAPATRSTPPTVISGLGVATLTVSVTMHLPQAQLVSTFAADPLAAGQTSPVRLRLAVPAGGQNAALSAESALLNGRPLRPLALLRPSPAVALLDLDPAVLQPYLPSTGGQVPLRVDLTIGAGHRLQLNGLLTVLPPDSSPAPLPAPVD